MKCCLDLQGHLQESIKYVCKIVLKEWQGGGLSCAESSTLFVPVYKCTQQIHPLDETSTYYERAKYDVRNWVTNMSKTTAGVILEKCKLDPPVVPIRPCLICMGCTFYTPLLIKLLPCRPSTTQTLWPSSLVGAFASVVSSARDIIPRVLHMAGILQGNSPPCLKQLSLPLPSPAHTLSPHKSRGERSCFMCSLPLNH